MAGGSGAAGRTGDKPADLEARIEALTDHKSVMLVEAGAGSGKTSILAGRVALMVAGGAKPGSIAAITFTEAAAAELRERISLFLEELAAGVAPRDLGLVLGDEVPVALQEGARVGLAELDELCASTIHGFAQTLLRPYPLEAGMDPGAAIVDPAMSAMAFRDSVTDWMRSKLIDDAGRSFVGVLFEVDAAGAELAARNAAEAMLRSRGLLAPDVKWDPAIVDKVEASAARWVQELAKSAAKPPEVGDRAEEFQTLINALQPLKAMTLEAVAAALALLAPDGVLTKEGNFRAKITTKVEWNAAGKEVGWNKRSADAMADSFAAIYEDFKAAWQEFKMLAAGAAARLLTLEAREALAGYAAWKRSAALVDFDDLLVKARDLLTDNEQIRQELGERFKYVLCDEFQDTDPLQAEILWYLCGEPAAGAATSRSDWHNNKLRPGSLFIVADAKQAIYRFRGADVRAYFAAREVLAKAEGAKILAISVNFRSTEQVLGWVNQIYKDPFEQDADQPGFQELTHFRKDGSLGVQALEVAFPAAVVNDKGQVTARAAREFEAKAIAELLTSLIGSMKIGVGDKERVLEPGDIALLAPTGASLWLYEAALERAGIAVAPQAGKGFLNRQEILDMTALARVLADPRDSLALGAFLRGPILGFTDEEILDQLHALPGNERKRLRLLTDIQELPEGRFRDAIKLLQELHRLARKTTSYQALSAAVEDLSIRAILKNRYQRSSERALANLGSFLSIAKSYDAKGMKAFADEMRRRRDEDTKQAEGRPDATRQSVSIVTLHSAKGLEWPVVLVINLATVIKDQVGAVSSGDAILMSILGEAMAGYGDASEAEKAEQNRERVRLFYVGDTRARDLLIIPRHSHATKDSKTWANACDRKIATLSSFDLSPYEAKLPAEADPVECLVDEAAFIRQAGAIAAASRVIHRLTPSLHENGDAPTEVVVEDTPTILASGEESEPEGVAPIKGSALRGILMHKLFEELLTGEIERGSLLDRSKELHAQLGSPDGIDWAEVAGKVDKIWDAEEIAAFRDRLVPEAEVYGLAEENGVSEWTVGVSDALAIAADGKIEAVFDWKSDVKVEQAALRKYREQVGAYKAASGAEHGFIVFATTGEVVTV